MKRRTPPREPHVLELTTPYAAAKALECLTWSAVRCADRAGFAYAAGQADAARVADAAARMCAARGQMLGYELIAPFLSRSMPARLAAAAPSHAADVAAIRGWRKRFPKLLRRLAV